ncbi:hypothetical protein BDV98DRAFT_607709 [Pterulicium gracile]|uniref:Uncharacterized protein n=1 Tax=Pterulicium gracile TaxID=1884261 RepID=A0A5C3QA30_9AGAR|nr:hypothetical protein BDV98DRAFT_607709 [Pterula gracilis]
MRVTFKVANYPARPVQAPHRPVKDATDVLQATWGTQGVYKELLQSTFFGTDTQQLFPKITPKDNGFGHMTITAYNEHQHLVLRPDDVWIAILGQLNFYVNAHAKELRHHFVAHKGKNTLDVKVVGTRYTIDSGDLARQMGNLIHPNVRVADNNWRGALERSGAGALQI